MKPKVYENNECDQEELTEQEKELIAWDMFQGLCREVTNVESNQFSPEANAVHRVGTTTHPHPPLTP